MSDTLTEQRVAAGAAWLDAVHPGWERKIDLALLRLRECEVCVLGQVVGTGWSDDAGMGLGADSCASGFQLVYAVADAVDSDTAEQWLADHGFMLESLDLGGARWAALDRAWGLLVKERFDSGLLSDEVVDA